MEDNLTFVSATGVELRLSPKNTWRLPGESYASLHSCWKDLIIPLEAEYTVVRPWRWYERKWFVSLFKVKPESWNVMRVAALPRMKAIMIIVLKHWVCINFVAVEESVTFDVSEVEPGVLHVEIRDDMEGWTAHEILDLPDMLWVG